MLAKLRLLSSITWQDIRTSSRHKLGYEKISRSSIKTSIPTIVTDDVSLIAFRMSGLAPMVGFRIGDVFRLLWLDPKFKLYDHGS